VELDFPRRAQTLLRKIYHWSKELRVNTERQREEEGWWQSSSDRERIGATTDRARRGDRHRDKEQGREGVGGNVAEIVAVSIRERELIVRVNYSREKAGQRTAGTNFRASGFSRDKTLFDEIREKRRASWEKRTAEFKRDWQERRRDGARGRTSQRIREQEEESKGSADV